MVPYQVIILRTRHDELTCCPLFHRNRALARRTKRFPDILCAVTEGLISALVHLCFMKEKYRPAACPGYRELSKEPGPSYHKKA